uniref:Uncharacterized protein n=1 Tax=Glossina palpalis gambiensis TaxID=67801 RepID=A0A1B0B9V2_9MUSC
MPDFVQTFLGKLRKLEKKPDKIVFVRYCIALATVFPLLAVKSTSNFGTLTVSSIDKKTGKQTKGHKARRKKRKTNPGKYWQIDKIDLLL